MDVIAFAERVLLLLEEATTTSTYKFALLLSLIDISMEQTSQNGDAPSDISTRRIAEHMAKLYWSQTLPLNQGDAELKQNSGRPAKMVSEIVRYQCDNNLSSNAAFSNARRVDSGKYRRLINNVEATLVKMPLGKLQNFANGENRFIYDYSGKGIITLKAGVGNFLVQLNGLLRPIIYRKWAALVAQFNGLQDSQLEDHLFNRQRVITGKTRPFLEDFQEGKCFYCDDKLGSKSHVDHFIPWARYPNDCLENFVLAHAKCNGDKKHYLAAKVHLDNWLVRFSDDYSADLFAGAAGELLWDSRPEDSLGIARSVYLGMPEGTPLWVGGGEFVDVERYVLRGSFARG